MMKYRAFIKVAETGNITKAARELGYSQPGISHMINALESEVGFPLLHRKKDAMTPTEDGKRILACCYQIVKDEDTLREAAKSINGLMSGGIRIGALNSTLVNFIPRIVREFSEKYPNIEITLHEYSVPELCNALMENKVDISFITEDAVPKGFAFSHIMEDPICLAMHRDHPFAAYDKIPISYLNGCDFIMPTPGWDELVVMVSNVRSFSPTIRHYTASDTVGISMVAENLGVFVISKLQTSLMPPAVVAKEFREGVYRNIGICARSLKNVPPSLHEFITTTHAVML